MGAQSCTSFINFSENKGKQITGLQVIESDCSKTQYSPLVLDMTFKNSRQEETTKIVLRNLKSVRRD